MHLYLKLSYLLDDFPLIHVKVFLSQIPSTVLAPHRVSVDKRPPTTCEETCTLLSPLTQTHSETPSQVNLEIVFNLGNTQPVNLIDT